MFFKECYCLLSVSLDQNVSSLKHRHFHLLSSLITSKYFEHSLAHNTIQFLITELVGSYLWGAHILVEENVQAQFVCSKCFEKIEKGVICCVGCGDWWEHQIKEESWSYTSGVNSESWKAGPEAQGKGRTFKVESSHVKCTTVQGYKVYWCERGQNMKLENLQPLLSLFTTLTPQPPCLLSSFFVCFFVYSSA